MISAFLIWCDVAPGYGQSLILHLWWYCNSTINFKHPLSHIPGLGQLALVAYEGSFWVGWIYSTHNMFTFCISLTQLARQGRKSLQSRAHYGPPNKAETILIHLISYFSFSEYFPCLLSLSSPHFQYSQSTECSRKINRLDQTEQPMPENKGVCGCGYYNCETTRFSLVWFGSVWWAKLLV